jgi:hypothetical protein
MAAQHGWSIEETEQRLLEVSEKAGSVPDAGMKAMLALPH